MSHNSTHTKIQTPSSLYCWSVLQSVQGYCTGLTVLCKLQYLATQSGAVQYLSCTVQYIVDISVVPMQQFLLRHPLILYNDHCTVVVCQLVTVSNACSLYVGYVATVMWGHQIFQAVLKISCKGLPTTADKLLCKDILFQIHNRYSLQVQTNYVHHFCPIWV